LAVFGVEWRKSENGGGIMEDFFRLALQNNAA